jgi:hypothetical protein
MREVVHADKSVNDRHTLQLEQAHLAAAEQTAALVRKARKGAAKSQPAGNGSFAGQTAWGGWGSNPRPADCEETGRLA